MFRTHATLAILIAVCAALVAVLAGAVTLETEDPSACRAMGFRLVLWLPAAVGLIAFLVAGDRLRERLGRDPTGIRLLQGGLAIAVLLLDLPGAHNGSDCGMSAGACSLVATGIWWLPNALYTLASLLVLASIPGAPGERARILPLWSGAVIALGSALELATRARPGLPWWGVHALVQLALVAPVAFTFRCGFRRQALVLPLFAALLPFGPWSFWHACTRLRPGDRVEDAIETMDGYWGWLASDTLTRIGPSTLQELDPRELQRREYILFEATGDDDACTCAVRFEHGRLVSFSMSPD